MRARRSVKLMALLPLLSGCEHSAPLAVPAVPLPAPVSTSLSPAARAQLRQAVDTEAMDRLLHTLEPRDRERFLASFQDAERAAVGRSDLETRDVGAIIWFADPERQRLLEQVWAPFWMQLPPAVLADRTHPLPGRALAIARSADSAAAGRKEREP